MYGSSPLTVLLGRKVTLHNEKVVYYAVVPVQVVWYQEGDADNLLCETTSSKRIIIRINWRSLNLSDNLNDCVRSLII